MDRRLIQAMLLNQPSLETPRLWLRRPVHSDLRAMYPYSSDLEVILFLRWGPHKDILETERYLREVLNPDPDAQDMLWMIVYKLDDLAIGHIHLMEIDAQHLTAQVGFVLGRKFSNHGLMIEALSEVLRFSFIELGLMRIEATCLRDNFPAARVLEKAVMHEEAERRAGVFQKGTSWDISIYAIQREAYKISYHCPSD